MLYKDEYLLERGFSNGGTRTTTGKPTIIYWYTALIKKSKYKKKIQILKNK
jgi:hypothetical protein